VRRRCTGDLHPAARVERE